MLLLKNLLIVMFTVNETAGVVISRSNRSNQYSDEVVELMRFTGYSYEVHEITTEDGYVLKMHRILPKNQSMLKKYPVFLMHGIIRSSSDYVLLGSENALSYMLSDFGYDVWMGNARGNTFCMKHRFLSADTQEFWEFSFHEIGYFDLAAMIDYVLRQTTQPSLYYFGHSQGGSAILVLLSTRPEYNAKIRQLHLLGPAMFLTNIRFKLINVAMQAVVLLRKTGINKLPLLEILKPFTTQICGNVDGICPKVMFFIIGPELGLPVVTNMSTIPSFIATIARFVSAKQFVHFNQVINSDRFQFFDYEEDNTRRYGRLTPPEYESSNINAPAYIYVGAEDLLITPMDTIRMTKRLPNVQKYRVMPKYGHMDFLLAKNVKADLYYDMLTSLEIDSVGANLGFG